MDVAEDCELGGQHFVLFAFCVDLQNAVEFMLGKTVYLTGYG